MFECTIHTSNVIKFKIPFSHYKSFEDFKQRFIKDLGNQSIYFGPFMNFELIVDHDKIKDKYMTLALYQSFDYSKLLLGNTYFDYQNSMKCVLNYNYNTSKFVYPIDVSETKYNEFLNVLFTSAYTLSKIDKTDDILKLITPGFKYIFPTYNLFITDKKWCKIYKALISMIRCLQ